MVEYLERQEKENADKEEKIRLTIEPFLKPTKGRWPIYHGPDEVVVADCKVATVSAWGQAYRWSSYRQCRHVGVISKDDILYCKIHDPDRPWPKILPAAYRKRMEILKVEIPEKMIPKHQQTNRRIEYRKSSGSWRLSPGASLRAIRKMYKELTWGW